MTVAHSFAPIDFETANSRSDSACSVGIVIVKDDEIKTVKLHLICPPSRNVRFTYIHRLKWTDVRDAPSFVTVWGEIAPAQSARDFLSAHNATFDRGVLYACCDRYAVGRPAHPFQCTIQLARSNWGIYPTTLRIPLIPP